MAELRLFFSYVLVHKYSYLLGIAFLFSTNWLAVNIPIYIGNSIDILTKVTLDQYDLLVSNIYYVIGFALLMMLSRTISRMLFFNPGRLVEKEIKNDAFTKLTQLQQGFYQKNPVGGLISIVNNDINGIRAMAGVGMMNIFNIMFTLSMTPLKMWQISPSLTLYCLAPIILSFFIVNHAINKMRQLLKERMHHLQSLSTQTVNYLNGVEVIKSHQIQPWVVDKFDEDNQAVLDLSIRQLRIRSFFIPLLEYTDAGVKILILSLGGLMLIRSELTLGQLTAFLTYAALFAMPMMSLGRLIATIQMGLVSLKSMSRILSEETKIDEGLNKSAEFKEVIKVRNLNFSYPDLSIPSTEESDKAKKQILKNINFEIFKGEKVALLGRVGSGKTTLVNCLNHFNEVDKASIYIDDIDITKITKQALRQLVRTVTQDPFLFSDTLKNNIEFGAEEQKIKQPINQVLKQSAMAQEVQNFSQGLETIVGEKGILLSGGQKQRISLARGIYTHSELLILDNVLSAVDNETERFLLNQLLSKENELSCLIVSHRQAVLERVDKILVMEEGEILAIGSHANLMQESEFYRNTWQSLQTEENVGAALV
ncbi:ABC transporter [Marinomonas sp. S3726]|uniref:ABC transporter ATP-binding protein n=1 Tax=Marinomonas sp. S3726 TaxID=579484 RepID=UPI0005FA821B|nr:ABC transporter ATP-binding protein [Marinomonas sp. S3726]KJZ12454.1 ABC transporter [Marinomonas sp. S3726]